MVKSDFTTWTIKDTWLAGQVVVLMVAAEVETPLSDAAEIGIVALVFAILYRLSGQPTKEI